MENKNRLSVAIHCEAGATYASSAFRSEGKARVALDLIDFNAKLFFHSAQEIRELQFALDRALDRLTREARAIDAERLTPQQEADRALADVRRVLREQEKNRCAGSDVEDGGVQDIERENDRRTAREDRMATEAMGA